MDIRQVEEQLALNLANAVFGDSPGGAILTSVTVTKQQIGAFLSAWTTKAALKCPFAILRVSSGKNDPDAATHASGSMGLGVRKAMRATIVVVAGSIADPLPSPPPFRAVGNVTGDDVHGQGAVIGKTVTIGAQAGQGVDRISPEIVRQALGNGLLIDSVHGVAGRVVGDSDLMEAFGVQVLGRRIDVEITNGSTVQSYHTPTRFKATVASTTVTNSWAAVPARPDFLSYLLKRDGTTIFTGTDRTVTTYADTGVSAGAHTYTLVAQYDDAARPPASANRSSSILSTTVTV